jgi:hypothetical protein
MGSMPILHRKGGPGVALLARAREADAFLSPMPHLTPPSLSLPLRAPTDPLHQAHPLEITKRRTHTTMTTPRLRRSALPPVLLPLVLLLLLGAVPPRRAAASAAADEPPPPTTTTPPKPDPSTTTTTPIPNDLMADAVAQGLANLGTSPRPVPSPTPNPPAGPGLLRGRDAADALASALAQPAPAGGATDDGVAPDDANLLPTQVRERGAFWAQELVRDEDLYFAPEVAKLVYACSGTAPSADGDVVPFDGGGMIPSGENQTWSEAAPADASGVPYPHELDPLISDAFKLHSRPGAPKIIVLDFTGHTMRPGTAWRSVNKFGDVPVVTPPYDLDGNPASFSSTERAAIVAIWRQVSEDFVAWDVDVTTEEPGGTDDQADAFLVGRGTRVAIGKNNGWFDNAGGVAFINGWAQSWAGPVAFVFNTFAPSVAVAVSHEVGHTFGLAHHGDACAAPGTLASAYYPGHGSWGAFCFLFFLRRAGARGEG